MPNLKVPYHYAKMVRLCFWTPRIRAQPKKVNLGFLGPACLIVERRGLRVLRIPIALVAGPPRGRRDGGGGGYFDVTEADESL